MNDDVLRLATIGRVLRRRRRLLLALALIGAALGIGSWLIIGSTYEANSKVLLQGPRAEEVVLTEAQIAMSLVVLDRAAVGLGWDTNGSDLSGSVTAEVISGNVIEIRATAQDPSRARELTDRITEEYIDFSVEIVTSAAAATRDALLERQASLEDRVEDLNQRIVELQGQFQLLDASVPQGAGERAELETLRATREEAFAELDNIDRLIGQVDAQDAVSREGLQIIQSAVAPSGAVPPTGLHLIAGGALLAVLLGSFVLVAISYNDRTLRRRADFAAAVDAPVLGTVEAPAGPPVTLPGADSPHRRFDRLRSWMKRITAEERPPPRPLSNRDEALDNLRYHRVLAQLPKSRSGLSNLLVVVVESDVEASRAAARLTIIAALDGRAVSLTTDSPQVTETVAALRADTSQRLGPIAVFSSTDPDVRRRAGPELTVTVVAVSASQPTVPNCPDPDGALLVVTSATATASELFGVARACREAGCPVAGVLLVVSPTDEDEDEDVKLQPWDPRGQDRPEPPRRKPQEFSALSNGSPGTLAGRGWKQSGNV